MSDSFGCLRILLENIFRCQKEGTYNMLRYGRSDSLPPSFLIAACRNGSGARKYSHEDEDGMMNEQMSKWRVIQKFSK